MKNKTLTFMLALCLAFMLLFGGCAKRELQFDIPDAASMTVFSGSTGKHVEITDAETVKYITDNINSLCFSRDKSSKNYEGFNYEITWYDANGARLESIIVMRENRISYDDYFYDNTADVGIDMDYIENLFE